MTTDLFNNQDIPANKDQQAQDNSNGNQGNQDKSIFEELVGPGKKFASPEDLAKGKKTADDFITKLQAEMQGLREELNRRTSAEEIIAQVRAELQEQNQGKGDNQSSSLDSDAVAKIVQSQLTEREQQRLIEKNMETVRSTLISHFGDDEAARKAIQDKATELGVPVDYLRNNAVQAPKAFLTLMGINAQDGQQNKSKTSPASPSTELNKSTQNSEALPQTATATQVKEYYDNLRRTNPSKYWSASTQQQIWKLMNEGKYSV